MWLTQSFASVVGAVIAAISTEKFHPKYVFFIYGCFGLVCGVSAFFLSDASEKEFLSGEEPDISDYSSEYIEG